MSNWRLRDRLVGIRISGMSTDNIEDPIPETQVAGEARAVELVQGIMSRMGYDATVSSRVVPAMDEDSDATLWIDVSCADAERLLEYRAEGLDALQMLTQTMWGHQTKNRMRLTVDLNGHRAEHQSNMMKMALRMAERVQETGRPIMLEPMLASERRLVHMALRMHEHVFSESQGEGGSRRVIIKPRAPSANLAAD